MNRDRDGGHASPSTDPHGRVDGIRRQARPLRMHQDSSQIQAFFNPATGVRDKQARSGVKPTDHARNNRTAIREMSMMNRARKEIEAECDQLESEKKFRARPAPTQRQKPTVGRGPSGRDFVGENIRDASLHKKTTDAPKSDGREFLKKETYGQVPMYLQERKIELAADKAMKAAEKEMEAIPPGMRVLGEQERLETLELLAQDRETVEAELRRMPFVVETPSLIRQKTALEDRLKEIDEAVRMFSRPRVLVRAF